MKFTKELKQNKVIDDITIKKENSISLDLALRLAYYKALNPNCEEFQCGNYEHFMVKQVKDNVFWIRRYCYAYEAEMGIYDGFESFYKKTKKKRWYEFWK